MNCIELIITAKAPLAIGRQKPGGSVSEAENYIPGSVIRGAIASQILQVANRQGADLSQNGGEFQTLFLDAEAAIFQNAYPAIARLNAQESALVADAIRVLPATALSSKENGGFKIDGKPDAEQKGGVFDTLIDRYCAELCRHLYDPSCPHDQGRVEPFGGFYSYTSDPDTAHRYRSHSTTTRFLTRVGINRRRATAQDEMLYSIEALNESFLRNTKAKYLKWEYFAYRSHIWIEDDDLANSLVALINRNSETFRIGGSTSRGLGRIHMNAAIKDDATDLPQRLEAFNTKLQERWQLWSMIGQNGEAGLGDRTYFTLDLQSHAVLTDHWQRTMVVSSEMLLDALGRHGISAQDLQLHASYASYDYRTGWNVAWGLMKEMELITNRGAVFFFSVSLPDLWKDEQWIKALASLEIQGIGDRTPEGFGQVRICDEFHTIFRENAV